MRGAPFRLPRGLWTFAHLTTTGDGVASRTGRFQPPPATTSLSAAFGPQLPNLYGRTR